MEPASTTSLAILVVSLGAAWASYPRLARHPERWAASPVGFFLRRLVTAVLFAYVVVMVVALFEYPAANVVVAVPDGATVPGAGDPAPTSTDANPKADEASAQSPASTTPQPTEPAAGAAESTIADPTPSVGADAPPRLACEHHQETYFDETICADPDAMRANLRMQRAFEAAWSRAAGSPAVAIEQAHWLDEQKAMCGDVACVTRVLDQRADELDRRYRGVR
jgi:hypothetical protein